MPYIAISVLIILLIGLFFAAYAAKIQKKEFEKTGKHPKGYYLSLGIAMGLPLGIPIGLVLGNIAIGPALGVGIGTLIGTYLEQKYKDELRPSTEEELSLNRKALSGLLILGLLVAIIFIVILILNK